jgi:hypothetical protein
MDAHDQKHWFPMAALIGAAYFVFGVAFATFASWSGSPAMRETWNRSGFAISAVAFLLHLGYEHFRLQSSPLRTASHVAMAVALGAFALAVRANIHGLFVGGANQRLLAIALVAWPAITAVPAFAVALAACGALAFKGRMN